MARTKWPLNRGGVYVIRNTINGKVYVGSTKCFRKRFHLHRSNLRYGRAAIHLQRAWESHGPECFAFEPILVCSNEHLVMYEQRCIDAFNAADPNHGYNGSPVAGGCAGHSEETKKKMSAGWTKRRAKIAAELAANPRVPRWTCERCGVRFDRKQVLSRPPIRFCSNECAHRWWIENTGKPMGRQWEKGRNPGSHQRARGEGNGKAKITADIVREVRRRFDSGEQQKVIAASMGLGETHVHKIAHRQTWKHVQC